MEIVKDVFKKPTTKRYFGKVRFGSPYFYPKKYNSSIIKIRGRRKGSDKWIKATYESNWNRTISIFGFEFCITVGYPIYFKTLELGWKDKWNTPRHEWNPAFYIYFFGLQYIAFKVAPLSLISRERNDDRYWEQWLWYTEYYREYGCDSPNIKKAMESWGWADAITKESTWDNSYLTFYGQTLTRN